MAAGDSLDGRMLALQFCDNTATTTGSVMDFVAALERNAGMALIPSSRYNDIALHAHRGHEVMAARALIRHLSSVLEAASLRDEVAEDIADKPRV